MRNLKTLAIGSLLLIAAVLAACSPLSANAQEIAPTAAENEAPSEVNPTSEPPQDAPTPAPESSVEAETRTEPPQSSDELTAAGWVEYCSPNYGYCIQHPEDAVLSESGIQGVPADEIPADADLDAYIVQLEATYGKDLCVQIRTPLAYLYISSPANESFKYAICGRTGVGAGEMTDVSQEVIVMGKTYTAEGFTVNMGGETTDLYNETLVFTLEDGTRIEYGSLPRGDATFVDYEMKGRPLIQQILETYFKAE